MTLDLPNSKKQKIIKIIGKIEKILKKEDRCTENNQSKCERKIKHKLVYIFERIIKNIQKLQKKKIISSQEAAQFVSVLEMIKSKVIR